MLPLATTPVLAATVALEKPDATVATAWMSLALELVQKTPGFSPPVASRVFGYLGVLMYEAVVPSLPERSSLVGQLPRLNTLPQPNLGQTYHWSTVANSALAHLMGRFFTSAGPEQSAKIAVLDAHMQTVHRRFVDEATFERSAQHGRVLADAIYTWSLEDGAKNTSIYTPSSASGSWQSTAPGHAGPLLPGWGHNQLFVPTTSADCRIPGPPPYNEAEESAFHTQALEVYAVSRTLTPEQREIALFWSDDPGQTATPAGHWIALLTQILKEQRVPLGMAVEAYAKLGIAVTDAFIACWRAKYDYDLLRPVTYIQRVKDADWLPLLNTPPFPEYPSGHSVQSAAAAEVLTDLFGPTRAFTDHTHETRSLPARSFTSFRQAASEAALSRLYGGIHFRAAIEDGLTLGRCIGVHVLALRWYRGL